MASRFPHYYNVPLSWRDFQETLRRQRPVAFCGWEELRSAALRASADVQDSSQGTVGLVPVRAPAINDLGIAYLGAVQVTARVPDWDFGPLEEGAFSMPDRAMELPCGWARGYAAVGGGSQVALTPNTYGEEENDDPQPERPEEISPEEWFGLNPAEMKLFAQNPQFIQAARLARAEAEAWSQSITSVGAHNGPQDALRHAFWMCRMTKTTSYAFAQKLGDAHEKYSTAYNEVRMDLFNNRSGRLAGLQSGSCETTVLAAYNSNNLAITPIPGPQQNPVGGATAPPPSGPAQ